MDLKDGGCLYYEDFKAILEKVIYNKNTGPSEPQISAILSPVLFAIAINT